MKRALSTLIAVALLASACFAQSSLVSQPYQPSPAANESRAIGRFYANDYGQWQARIMTGNGSTGAGTILVSLGVIALPDGRNIIPFNVGAPILVDVGTAQETVTPTAVSNCYYSDTLSVSNGTCAITATFSNIHGQGAIVTSGTAGLQEAIDDAALAGGGLVVVDQQWYKGLGGALPGTVAMITAALPFPNVSIEDTSNGATTFWNVGPSTATFLATPAVLTNSTAGFGVAGANFTGGAYTGSSTYIACVAYVDIAGNEGACSPTFTLATSGSATTDQIGFTPPAASTGAVGYTIYIDLAGGTYALAYQVPLTSSVCTLTKVETVTPACAVTNTAYNQIGSNAIVSALTVNTAPIALQLGGVAGQAGTGNPNAHTTYAYVSGSRLGNQGLMSASLPFTANNGSLTSTTVDDLGTIAIPAGYMNMVGKTIRVCGKLVVGENASGSAETVKLLWDGAGSNSAGTPVTLGTFLVTTGTPSAANYNESFCADLTTTVSGAGATAGSILPTNGSMVNMIANGSAAGIAITDTNTGTAVGSLNLAGTPGNTTRLHVQYSHTGGTDTAATLVGLTVEAL